MSLTIDCSFLSGESLQRSSFDTPWSKCESINNLCYSLLAYYSERATGKCNLHQVEGNHHPLTVMPTGPRITSPSIQTKICGRSFPCQPAARRYVHTVSWTTADENDAAQVNIAPHTTFPAPVNKNSANSNSLYRSKYPTQSIHKNSQTSNEEDEAPSPPRRKELANGECFKEKNCIFQRRWIVDFSHVSASG